MSGSAGLLPEDVLRLRFIRDAQLAPDGARIAYALMRTDVSQRTDLCEIWLRDCESGSETRLTDEGWAAHPRWAPDGSLLAFTRKLGDVSSVGIMSREGRVRDIAIESGAVAGPLVWSPDGKRIALVISTPPAASQEVRRTALRDFRADGIGFIEGIEQRLCLLEVATGRLSTLHQNLSFYSCLDFDACGERLLFLGTSTPIPGASYSPKLYSIVLANGHVAEHLDEGWYIRCARWVPGGRQIAVIGARRSPVTVPTTDLWVVEVDGGGEQCRSMDVQGRVGVRIHHDMPLWDAPWFHDIVFRDASTAWVTVQSGGRAEVWAISLCGAPLCERVLGGDRSYVVINASGDKTRILCAGTDVATPPELYVLRESRAQQVTHVNAEVLAGWPALHQRRLCFRSTDGLELEGSFISTDSAAQWLPTVLFIHGGPFIAAGDAYRFDFHLLASHGFGVLFANFRGSFGYGESFAAAIMGDWGARGFGDHMATADHAVGLALADPARLGVWGASHGGFATCWIVGHTGRFRAAVAEAAVVNLTTAYYLSDAPDIFSRDLGGKPHQIPDVYRSRSPLSYAHFCRTPTLLIHGERDYRCPIAEAEQFHRALLDVNCVSEMVRLRDADHMGDSMGPPGARVGQNAALLDWFVRFL